MPSNDLHRGPGRHPGGTADWLLSSHSGPGGQQGRGERRFGDPVVAELAREHAGELKVVKVNTEREPSLGTGFNVRSIPTIVLFRGGRGVARVVGALPRRELERRLGLFTAQA
jgi:thiol-disulfide isomerase/thioredoxin